MRLLDPGPTLSNRGRGSVAGSFDTKGPCRARRPSAGRVENARYLLYLIDERLMLALSSFCPHDSEKRCDPLRGSDIAGAVDP